MTRFNRSDYPTAEVPIDEAATPPTRSDVKIKPHVLVVTGQYNADGSVDGREFSLRCPGVPEGQCGGYTFCEVPDCPIQADPPGGKKTVHGVEHASVDGQWMVPTGECYYLTFGADGMPDAASDLRVPGTSHDLDAGEYEVIPEYYGDGEFHLDLVSAAE